MFKELKNVLEENDLPYYIVGGTLLGAVRHKGFIPWDDDIDISLPRPAYDRFIRDANKLLPPHYRLESFVQNNNYQHLFAKVYDTRTTMIENFTQPLVRGVYIDIFPLDGITSNTRHHKVQIKKMRLYIKIYRRIFTTKVRSRSFYKRLSHQIIAPLVRLFFTKESILRMVNNLSQQVPWSDAEYIVNYFGAWRMKEVQPKSWYEKRRRYIFDGFEVWGPNEYDKVLTKLYGDYMQLPPKEKRCSHHIIKHIDLTMPYEEYKG